MVYMLFYISKQYFIFLSASIEVFDLGSEWHGIIALLVK